MCTVHTGPYTREQTAQCGVNHGGRSMIREAWIYDKPTDENNTLTCDMAVENWESISIKTKKHFRSSAEDLLVILQFCVCEPILCRNLQVACRAEKRSSQDRVCSTQPPASIIQPQSYLWKWFSLNIEKLSNTSIISELWMYRHRREYDLWSVICHKTMNEWTPPATLNEQLPLKFWPRVKPCLLKLFRVSPSVIIQVTTQNCLQSSEKYFTGAPHDRLAAEVLQELYVHSRMRNFPV